MAKTKKRNMTSVEFDDCIQELWDDLTTTYGIKPAVSMAFMLLSRTEKGIQAELLSEFKLNSKRYKAEKLAIAENAAAEELEGKQKHSRDRRGAKVS